MTCSACLGVTGCNVRFSTLLKPGNILGELRLANGKLDVVDTGFPGYEGPSPAIVDGDSRICKRRSIFFWSLAPSAACRSLGTNAHKQLLLLGFPWNYDEPTHGRHRQANLLVGMGHRSAVLKLPGRCHNSCGRSTCCRLKGRARKIETQLPCFLK